MAIADRLLTLKDAAPLLACSGRTVRRLIKDGTLPGYRVRAHLCVKESDVACYVESRRIPQTADPSSLEALASKYIERARARRA
jgi:excisionase family DNA binding protein